MDFTKRMLFLFSVKNIPTNEPDYCSVYCIPLRIVILYHNILIFNFSQVIYYKFKAHNTVHSSIENLYCSIMNLPSISGLILFLLTCTFVGLPIFRVSHLPLPSPLPPGQQTLYQLHSSQWLDNHLVRAALQERRNVSRQRIASHSCEEQA